MTIALDLAEEGLPRKVAAVDWQPGDWLPGVTLDGYAGSPVSIKDDHGAWCDCEDELTPGWSATWEVTTDAFRWVPDMEPLEPLEEDEEPF